MYNIDCYLVSPLLVLTRETPPQRQPHITKAVGTLILLIAAPCVAPSRLSSLLCRGTYVVILSPLRWLATSPIHCSGTYPLSSILSQRRRNTYHHCLSAGRRIRVVNKGTLTYW